MQPVRDIDITDTIAVRHAKWLVCAEVSRHALQAAACHCLHTRVHECYVPALRIPFVRDQLVLSQIEGYIRRMQAIIGEILLNHISFKTQANNEARQTRNESRFS